MSPSNATPFTTLPALRRAHTALLRRRQSSSDAPRLTDLLEFMRQAQASGRSIADEDARDAAQTIIDYWYGALVREARTDSSLPLPTSATLDAFDGSVDDSKGTRKSEISEPERNARQAEALKASIEKFESTPQLNSAALRRLLLRLFKINPATGRPERFQCPVKDLSNAADEELLTKPLLEGAPSLLQLEPAAGSSEPNAYALQHDSLFEDWTRLKTIVDERRSLRALTIGWIKSGKDSSALLTRGDLSSLSDDYRDLSADESRFLKASREAALDLRKSDRAILGGWILALICLSIWLFVEKRAADKTNEQLTIAKTKLEAAISERDEAEEKRKSAFLLSEAAMNGDLAKLRTENARLQEKLRTTEAGYEVKLATLAKAIKSSASPQSVSVHQFVSTYAEKKLSQDRTPLQSDIILSFSNTELPAEKQRDDLSPVSPGSTISTSTGADASRGSLGIYLCDPASPNNVYVVGPRYLLSGKEGDPLYVGTSTQPFATLSNRVQLDAADFTDLVLAKVSNPKLARNSILSIGTLEGTADPASLPPGTPVTLIGSGSGISTGKFLRMDEKGNAVTNRISKAGDAGAPVVVPDPAHSGQYLLLGILLARGENAADESIVRPLAPFLKDKGLKLCPLKHEAETPNQNLLNGALAEIFVHDSNPEWVTKAGPLITALQKAGITFPVPNAQTKPQVADPSEVRYFYEEDEQIAQRILDLLKKSGLKDRLIKTVFLPDDTAPRKFIQVSLAKYAFTGTPVSPTPSVTPTPPAPVPSPTPPVSPTPPGPAPVPSPAPAPNR